MSEIKDEDGQLFEREAYEKEFFEEVDLFLARFQRFKCLVIDNYIDRATYLDVLLLHMRVLLCDMDGKAPYSVQRFLKNTGRKDLAQEINRYLDVPFNDFMEMDGNPISIRDAIRFVVNKRIAHVEERDVELKSLTHYFAVEFGSRKIEEAIGKIVAVLGKWRAGLLDI